MSNVGMIAAGRGRMLGKRLGSGDGFTLIELMVTLAVVGILAAVAAPAMTSLINGNRLASTSSEITASLQLARSEAMRRNSRVTVCASDNAETCTSNDDWSSWIVVGRDNAANGGAGADDVIVARNVEGTVQVAGPENGIVFRPSGLIDAAASLAVCAPTSALTENQRDITVMISGNITNSRSAGGAECND